MANNVVKLNPIEASGAKRKTRERISVSPAVKIAESKAPIKRVERSVMPLPHQYEAKRKAPAMPRRVVWESELANMDMRFKTINGPRRPQAIEQQAKTPNCISSVARLVPPPVANCQILFPKTQKNSK